MRIYLLLFIFILGFSSSYAQPNSVPAEFLKVFNDKGLDKKYTFYNFLDGLYWDEDFNGDGKIDIAILIAEISTKKKGILIIDGKTGNYFVFGAGIKFWKEHDDFSGAKRWGVSSQKDADDRNTRCKIRSAEHDNCG